PELYARGHISGAVNLPHGKIIESGLRTWPAEALFIVYCAGPHCNGADRAALRLAVLGRPVKLMIGGITGWIDEGFDLVAAAVADIQMVEAAI
ncbi:MAG: rhodanese-like domain-containing protein, partial [Alphaproteobacteria bacterium]